MLIKCQKEISDRALSCPNFGYSVNSQTIIESNDEDALSYPSFPTYLSIGKQIVNWT